jgi:hypothetical protein
MVKGIAANVISVVALLNTQALGTTCLAGFVKAPASGGKSALVLSISKRYACLSLFCHTVFSGAVFVCGVVFA